MNNEPSQKPEIIDISKKVNEFIKFSLIGFLLILLLFWAGYLFISEIRDKADFCERCLKNVKYQSYRQSISLRRNSSKLYEHFIFGDSFIEEAFADYTGRVSIKIAEMKIFYQLMKDIYPIWTESGIFKLTKTILKETGQESL